MSDIIWQDDNGVVGENAGILLSVTQPAPNLTPEGFLATANGQERFYWADSGDGATFAGIGIAANLVAWGADRFTDIETQAQQLFAHAHFADDGYALAKPRLFGGFSFRDDFTPDNTWATFPPAQFVLPHYQFVMDGAERWLTLNVVLSDGEDIDEAKTALQTALSYWLETVDSQQSAVSSEQSTVSISYPMSFEKWEAIINETVERTKNSALKKAVLSRVCEIRFEENINLDSVLAHLHTHYPNCYHFVFEPRPHHAFFGATPELLVHLTGRTVHTAGLAGSAPRGDTPEADDAFGEALLDSAKDRWEHQLVVDAIKRRLETVTERLTVPANPILFKLSNIQHLYTPIYGRLSEKGGVLPLVALLHPTPALGGSPRDLALALIREAEPVPRGWYAAPIGMLDHNLDGTFGVAIRSAVSQYKRVWLHAGAGIVSASDPQKEWDETELKFKPMLNALGV